MLPRSAPEGAAADRSGWWLLCMTVGSRHARDRCARFAERPHHPRAPMEQIGQPFEIPDRLAYRPLRENVVEPPLIVVAFAVQDVPQPGLSLAFHSRRHGPHIRLNGLKGLQQLHRTVEGIINVLPERRRSERTTVGRKRRVIQRVPQGQIDVVGLQQSLHAQVSHHSFRSRFREVDMIMAAEIAQAIRSPREGDERNIEDVDGLGLAIGKDMARIGMGRCVQPGRVRQGGRKEGAGGSRQAGNGLYLRELRSLRPGTRSAVPSFGNDPFRGPSGEGIPSPEPHPGGAGTARQASPKESR